jgi:DNA-binding IclR family transcriptional regulator
VQSVERALAVLRLLANERVPLRLADIQRGTGLQKSIAFRLLKTLEAGRFVEQEPGTSRFQIGVGAFEVAQAYPRGGSLIRACLPHLQALVEGSPHTAYLATLDGFQIVYLASVEGTGPLRVHVSPGRRIAAYATAVGKALLAELDDAEVDELARSYGLAALTPATITSRPGLLECIREVRDRGYALNMAEAYPGIGSVAAVVRDGSSKASTGITLSYATSLVAPDELPAWIERTTATADAISAALGGTTFDGGIAA